MSLVVDFSDKIKFEKAKYELTEIGISIIKSEEVVEKLRMTFILIGKLDVRKITEETMSEKVRITDFEVSAPTSKEACIRVNVEAPLDSVDTFVAKLRSVATREDAILISSY